MSRKNCFIKISGDMLSDDVLHWIKELSQEYFVIVCVGGGTQINEAFTTAGLPVREFGPLGRETENLEEKVKRIAKELKIIPILEEEIYAVAMCGGIINGCLGLSPREIVKDGEKLVVYSFRILSRHPKNFDYYEREIDLEADWYGTYRVTATDVRMDFEIIRKGIPKWSLQYLDVDKDKIPSGNEILDQVIVRNIF